MWRGPIYTKREVAMTKSYSSADKQSRTRKETNTTKGNDKENNKNESGETDDKECGKKTGVFCGS